MKNYVVTAGSSNSKTYNVSVSRTLFMNIVCAYFQSIICGSLGTHILCICKTCFCIVWGFTLIVRFDLIEIIK